MSLTRPLVAIPAVIVAIGAVSVFVIAACITWAWVADRRDEVITEAQADLDAPTPEAAPDPTPARKYAAETRPVFSVTRDNRIVACARYRCDCGTLVIEPLPVEHWQCPQCVVRAELDAWGVQA